MTVLAFAKINLDLRVLYKRPDGYHELRTIFQTISLADEITIHYQPAPDLKIHLAGNIEIADNLIARAARLVMEEYGLGGEIALSFKKHIPMGAGLGGGSSDAAAILRILPALTGFPIAPARLPAIATALGSDVPFFLYGGTAVGLGRGEELYPLPDITGLEGILITPPIHVATAEAYGALSPRLAHTSPDTKRAQFAEVAWTGNLALARNDFEEPVFALHPELARLREMLEQTQPVTARMTGSGSSLFALYPIGESQQHLVALSEFQPIPFTLISRQQYLETEY